MSIDENKIIFREIKSYEEAYYYNSDPRDRIEINKKESKIEKKKSNASEKVGGVIGEIVEAGLEILFSFLD